MPDITKVLRLQRAEYFKTHLSIINAILPKTMTPTEIEVLSVFMALEGDLAEYRFSLIGRKVVMKRLNLSPSGLSNYLKQLSNKGFIKVNEEGETYILPLLIPQEHQQIYMFKLINLEQPQTTNT